MGTREHIEERRNEEAEKRRTDDGHREWDEKREIAILEYNRG
jgi:hypothetical protein